MSFYISNVLQVEDVRFCVEKFPLTEDILNSLASLISLVCVGSRMDKERSQQAERPGNYDV